MPFRRSIVMRHRVVFLILAALPLCLTPAAPSQEKTGAPVANRPKLARTLRLTLRDRREEPPSSGKFKIRERQVEWKDRDTPRIICDMWDDHFRKLAGQRIGEMAPEMNKIISAPRSHGVMIIHSPS